MLQELPLLQTQPIFRATWPIYPLPFDWGDHSFSWKGGGWDAALLFIAKCRIRETWLFISGFRNFKLFAYQPAKIFMNIIKQNSFLPRAPFLLPGDIVRVYPRDTFHGNQRCFL